MLTRLDKGHTAADLHRCVELLREVGIEPRPSLLPFTPWTRRRDLVELLDFVAAHDLIPNVDPVQYSIRLLLPPHSLLLDPPDPVLAGALLPASVGEIAVGWRSADPVLDELASALAALAEESATEGALPEENYRAVRRLVLSTLGEDDRGLPPLACAPGPAPSERGRLDESWFCCAEPTLAQLGRLASEEKAVFLGSAIPTARR